MHHLLKHINQDIKQRFYEEKWNSRQLLTLYFTITKISLGGKANINSHTTLKVTVFMKISCIMCSCHQLVFNVVTSTYARHSLNTRNVINWKRNFKENIIKKYLEENITKEVVIIRIKVIFLLFTKV